MRSLPISLLLFGAFVAIFGACKKESPGPNNKHVGGLGMEKLGGSDCARSVRVVCGMLAFNDQAHFQEVYDCLEAAYEAHMDAFEAQWGYLSEDDYNDMADQLGFVDEQPLIDFEQTYSFSSYRAQMTMLEDAFLLNGGDTAFSPEADNLFDDQVLETMYNANGAIMIGGIVHYRAPDGTHIDFCNCEVFEQYLTDPASVNVNDPCVGLQKTLFCSSPCDCCKSYQLDSDIDEYVTNERYIRWTLRFEYDKYWAGPQGGGFVWNHRSCAKIVHYKKVNGRWKRRRADLLARTEGVYSGSNDQGFCKEPVPYFKEKAKRRKVLEARNWYGAPYYVRTFKTGEAKGYWEYPNSNYLNKILEFPC